MYQQYVWIFLKSKTIQNKVIKLFPLFYRAYVIFLSLFIVHRIHAKGGEQFLASMFPPSVTKLDDRRTLDRGREKNGRRVGVAFRPSFFLTYLLTACRIARKDNYSFSIDVRISEISASQPPRRKVVVVVISLQGTSVGELAAPAAGGGGGAGGQSEGFAEERLADRPRLSCFSDPPTRRRS